MWSSCNILDIFSVISSPNPDELLHPLAAHQLTQGKELFNAWAEASLVPRPYLMLHTELEIQKRAMGRGYPIALEKPLDTECYFPFVVDY